MYKIVIMSLLMIGFSGCATTYGTGKVLYTGAKKVYIELEIENDKLESIDSVLVIYDKVRTTTINEVNRRKKLDADILQAPRY